MVVDNHANCLLMPIVSCERGEGVGDTRLAGEVAIIPNVQ